MARWHVLTWACGLPTCAGAVAYLAPLIVNPDSKLKRQVCSCLAQIAKHSTELAEVSYHATTVAS